MSTDLQLIDQFITNSILHLIQCINNGLSSSALLNNEIRNAKMKIKMIDGKLRENNSQQTLLYEKYQQTLQQQFITQYELILNISDEIKFVETVSIVLKRSQLILNLVNDIFESVIDVSSIGYELLHKHMISKYTKELCDKIFLYIEQKRQFLSHSETQYSIVIDCVKILKIIQDTYEKELYTLHLFYVPFINDSKLFYKTQSNKWINTMSSAEYITTAAKYIELETTTISSLLKTLSIQQNLLSTVKNELFQKHFDKLIDDKQYGIQSLLWMLPNHNNTSTVINALNIVSELCDINEIIKDFIIHYCKIQTQIGDEHLYMFLYGYIRMWCTENIYDSIPNVIVSLCIQYYGGHKSHLLQSLIDLIQGLRLLNRNVLNDSIIRIAFGNIIKNNVVIENKLAKAMAEYCHIRMQKNKYQYQIEQQRNYDEEFKNVLYLYGVIGIFSDLVFKEYQKLLSKRLIEDNGWNETLEQFMINRLKNESFASFNTNKLEEMCNDGVRSIEFTQDFKQKYDSQMDLHRVLICNKGIWPKFESSKVRINIPDNTVTNMIDAISVRYLNKYSARAIQWYHEYSSARLTVQFNRNTRKVLIVPFYQMCILLCFNYKTVLRFGEILHETKIGRKDLVNAILSMAHPKVKILRKSPNTKICEDWHKFQINSKFKNARQLIRLKTVDICKTNDTIDESSSNRMIALDKSKNSARVNIFEISVVMEWFYNVTHDICAICRNGLHELCIHCQSNPSANNTAECTLAWGMCNHQFHFHCISGWLRRRGTCPLDNKEWELQTTDFL